MGISWRSPPPAPNTKCLNAQKSPVFLTGQQIPKVLPCSTRNLLEISLSHMKFQEPRVSGAADFSCGNCRTSPNPTLNHHQSRFKSPIQPFPPTKKKNPNPYPDSQKRAGQFFPFFSINLCSPWTSQVVPNTDFWHSVTKKVLLLLAPR